MIEYTFGASKTRVWWAELPDWSYEVQDTIRLELDLQSLSPRLGAEKRCGALEMLRPRGGRAVYGGLGATFSPQKTGPLIVEIMVSPNQGQLWLDSLAGRVDTVRKGFPYEFVAGVSDGILTSENKYLLGPGTLRFAWAVYGVVGSSRWIFHVLSDSLAELLVREQSTTTVTFEELNALIGRADQRSRRFYGNWPVDNPRTKGGDQPDKGTE